MPPLFPMAEDGVYMNFLDSHASMEAHTEVMKVAHSWSSDKVKTQLAKNMISVCLIHLLLLLVLSY